MVELILEGGKGRGLVLRSYKALKKDRTAIALKARQAWDRDLQNSLTDAEWAKPCAKVQEVASNARFKLAHFNFPHRMYLIPTRIHRI